MVPTASVSASGFAWLRFDFDLLNPVPYWEFENSDPDPGARSKEIDQNKQINMTFQPFSMGFVPT
jgi:hypothetical protein